MRLSHSNNTKDPKRIQKHLKGSKMIQEIPKNSTRFQKASKTFQIIQKDSVRFKRNPNKSKNLKEPKRFVKISKAKLSMDKKS